MSRTDKDRPHDIKCDDSTEKRWYIDHGHGLRACDYHPKNNTRLFRDRTSSPLQFLCSGWLIMARHDSYARSRRDRRAVERKFRHNCRARLRHVIDAELYDKDKHDQMLFLRHPKRITEVRGQ